MKVERRIEQLVGRQLVLELPETFKNHWVEVIVLTLDDETRSECRPHPSIAGKMKIHGEIFDSAPDVPETRLEDLIGCTGYKGPAKSLEEMEAGVVERAYKSYLDPEAS